MRLRSRLRLVLGLAAGWVIFAGCGNLQTASTATTAKLVPDSSQVKILELSQLTPQQGPLGTVINIRGRGELFPAGIVTFRFSGAGGLEFEIPNPTQTIQLRVPPGTISGPFGFTISGRRSQILDNALPTTDVFESWRFLAPGFIVTPDYPPTGVPLIQPPNQHLPPNG